MMNRSAKIYGEVKREVAKTIIGYQDIVEDFLICLTTGGHLMLEGVPGVAKTTLAKTFAEIIGVKFNRIQFTQDLLPSDITGHYYFNQTKQEFEFRPGPIFSNVVLADEINRAPSKTQSALLESMEETQVTVEGNTFKLQDPFLVMATINPIESEGVYSLPEAQLDRFMIKSKMDYLEENEELLMLKMKSSGTNRATPQKLPYDVYSILREEYLTCHIDASILNYIKDIIIETRRDQNVNLGASPRAGEQMLYAAKAAAILEGRDHVIPDDVKRAARKMIPHRIMISLDVELEGTTAENIVEKVLSRVEVIRRPDSPAPGKQAAGQTGSG